MNKFCKVVAGIGGGLLALGLVLTLAGLIMGGTYRELESAYHPGFRVGPFGSGRYWGDEDDIPYWEETGSTEFSKTFEDVESLYVDCGMSDTHVAVGDAFRVDARNLGRFALRCQLEDGRLTVVCKPGRGFGSLRRGEKVPVVTITLPKDFVAEDVVLEVGMGTLSADRLHARNAYATVGMGEMILRDFSSDGGSIECGMGSVEIHGAVTGSQTVDCGMGSVEMFLEGDPGEYDYSVSVGMGEVSVAGEDGAGLGKSFSRSTGAANCFSIDCSMGAVDIDIEE